MQRALIALVIAAGFSVATPSTGAPPEDKTHHLTLYGMGAFIEGDVKFGEFQGQVDIDASDIFDALEAALFGRYRNQSERWAFVGDVQYSDLAESLERFPITTDLDIEFLVLQGDVAYRFSDRVEALAGIRYVRFEGEVDVFFAGAGSVQRENDASFWDPVVGVRTLRPLSDRLWLQAQGDIGGGANMDFTWQGMVHLGYVANESVSLWFGYRGLGMEFDDSGGRNRVDADLIQHGPEVGVAFHF